MLASRYGSAPAPVGVGVRLTVNDLRWTATGRTASGERVTGKGSSSIRTCDRVRPAGGVPPREGPLAQLGVDVRHVTVQRCEELGDQRLLPLQPLTKRSAARRRRPAPGELQVRRSDRALNGHTHRPAAVGPEVEQVTVALVRDCEGHRGAADADRVAEAVASREVDLLRLGVRRVVPAQLDRRVQPDQSGKQVLVIADEQINSGQRLEHPEGLGHALLVHLLQRAGTPGRARRPGQLGHCQDRLRS